ncbi:hypothetical protein SALBM311S_00284 [Streptomyces alboniger]
MSPTQWPATKELVKDDGEMVFEDGISPFCPKHSKILKSAVEGTYPRWFSVTSTPLCPGRTGLSCMAMRLAAWEAEVDYRSWVRFVNELIGPT